jgi:hypothetical protein
VEHVESETVYVNKMTRREAVAEARKPSPFDALASREHSDSWAGSSFDDAITMAERGYPKGALALKARLGMFAKVREAVRPRPAWDVAGSSVDVGRYLSGEPECMVEVVRGRRQSPVLRMSIERSASSDRSAEEIETVGASALAAVEALRTAGVPCEVWAVFTTTGPNSFRHYSTQVLVQEAGRPVDTDVLAFWTMHPAALRRVNFSIRENDSPQVRREFGVGNNYGYPTTLKSAGLGNDFDENVPSRAHEVQGWLVDVLTRRIGVTIGKDA